MKIKPKPHWMPQFGLRHDFLIPKEINLHQRFATDIARCFAEDSEFYIEVRAKKLCKRDARTIRIPSSLREVDEDEKTRRASARALTAKA